ncbi:MAG: hypothetical protein Kow0047_33270 [Anaerolineae bacterium]
MPSEEPFVVYPGEDHLPRATASVLLSAALGQKTLVVILQPGADLWWISHVNRYNLEDITIQPFEPPFGLWRPAELAPLRLLEALYRAREFDVVALYGVREAIRDGALDPDLLLTVSRAIARQAMLYLA